MSHVAAYVAALAVFLIIDAIWLTAVMKPLFKRNLGDMLLSDPRLGPAGAFYALYVVGILYFATWPSLSAGSWHLAVIKGAFLGFLAYGTYEATNLATLRGWTWGMLAIDVTWGMALTAISSLTGFMAYRSIAG